MYSIISMHSGEIFHKPINLSYADNINHVVLLHLRKMDIRKVNF